MSVRFDAANDRISYTASNPPDTSTGITVLFWAYLSVDRDDFSTFIRLHANTGGTTRVTYATNSGGTNPGLFSPGNTGGVNSPLALVVGSWRRMAMTATGTSGTIYCADDSGGATQSATGTVSGGSAPTGFTLGGRSAGDATEWFNGRLQYLRIYSAVLTQSEIEAEWASTTPVRTSGLWANYPLTVHTDLTDHSGNGRNLVAGSTATTTEADAPVSAVTTGTIAGTLSQLTADLDGTAFAAGSMASTLPAVTAATTGTASAAGALVGTLQTPTGATVGQAIGSGLVAAQLAEAVASLAGNAATAGAATGDLPALEGSFVSTAETAGTLAGEVLALQATLNGSVETDESMLLGVLPQLAGEVAAQASATAAMAGQLTPPVAELSGGSVEVLFIIGQLPELVGELTGLAQVPGSGALTVVLPQLLATTGRRQMIVEQNQQRRITMEFIKASPVLIALIPNAEVRTASGAVTMAEGVARPIQRFRLIPMSHTERPRGSATSGEGPSGDVQRKYDMTILGEWDAVIQENDFWRVGDQLYVVEALVPFNGYERKGLVMSYGRGAAIV